MFYLVNTMLDYNDLALLNDYFVEQEEDEDDGCEQVIPLKAHDLILLNIRNANTYIELTSFFEQISDKYQGKIGNQELMIPVIKPHIFRFLSGLSSSKADIRSECLEVVSTLLTFVVTHDEMFEDVNSRFSGIELRLLQHNLW